MNCACFVTLLALSVDPYSVCDSQLREAPGQRSSWACFWETALNDPDQQRIALRRIEGWLAHDNSNGWGHYARGEILLRLGAPEARVALRRAAELFVARNDAAGQVQALTRLAAEQTRQGAFAAAEQTIDEAEVAARSSGDGEMLARALERRGWNALRQAQFTKARLAFIMAAQALPENASPRLSAQIEISLAGLAWAIGRLPEAYERYQRAIELDAENHFALANLLPVAMLLAERGELNLEQARSLAEEALKRTQRQPNPLLANRAYHILSLLESGTRGAEFARKAVAEAERSTDPVLLRGQERASARRLLELDPRRYRGEAEALLAASRQKTKLHGGAEERIRMLDEESHCGLLTEQPGRAESALRELLDLAESIREIQSDQEVRSASFAAYVPYYHRLAGQLLRRTGADPDTDRIAQAFEIQERARARLLLDHLDAHQATAAATRGVAASDAHQLAVSALVQAQRELRRSDLTSSQRVRLAQQLERLEAQERLERLKRAELDPAYARLRPVRFANILEIQRALRPDEAMLSVQLARSHDAGSWITWITPNDTAVKEIPLAGELEPLIELYLGLIARRDGGDRELGVRLADILLDRPLRDPRVRRVVVIPDGPLWLLPWSALFGDTIEATTAPSATIWLRLRNGDTNVDSGILSLVDPIVDSGPNGRERASIWPALAELSSLPRARAEGRSFQRTIPRENRLLIGSEASEQALKRIDLSPYSIVHLAAHAIVVDESPERSGVLLAPGSEGEDGLLQVREIVELPLHGKTVVLTACRSAAGGVLAGEGPLSLSRSFLEAGAKAVVGGLWPLRDDEAELVVQHLAEQLAQGSTIASALHVAQSRLREQGKPVAAWAGLVALGDGATTPYPRGFERRSRAFGVAVALVAGMLIALLVAASRRRVTRPPRAG
jgi:hypothetical protein